MRNVVKGFQMSKMAVPKVHEKMINSGFAAMHEPKLRRPALRLNDRIGVAKNATRPGKNPGIGRGYSVL